MARPLQENYKELSYIFLRVLEVFGDVASKALLHVALPS